ncbi:CYTH domain-containing protein [Endozoicomonas sp. SM1973]|uniref:CYTH domain-containing protein n=1 Tax=Spartinivicinus marinus TaxID=2994442 RepID=A0A853I1X5_9GAMM|nr:CYTH domain-containing protein [Spartinivicinus marinus]MCX4026136.1 CYTH domain-containing protein [Spartinivicinus marinus]NYZ66619.1 CYTH domain-containing protein [Spartinivicinus marinus]
MGTETEVKLALQDTSPDEIKQAAFFKQYQSTLVGTKPLINIYFDTPAGDLHQQKMALRIRQLADGGLIQTLKTRGKSVAGLSSRQEWEWPIKEKKLDTTLLNEVWPQSLAVGVKEQLVPVFETNFERTIWLVEWHHDKSVATVELALDQGFVIAGSKTQPINELELELKAGDKAALINLAELLQKQFSLQPYDLSKAERGYQLLDKTADF